MFTPILVYNKIQKYLQYSIKVEAYNTENASDNHQTRTMFIP